MKKPSQGQILKALYMASPFCLIPRFSDGLGHCIDASLAGAAVLSRFGLAARAVQCAVVIRSAHDPREQVVACGISTQQLYTRFHPEPHNFSNWAAARGLSAENQPDALHVIIEAGKIDRTLVDLTLGQAKAGSKLDIPLQLMIACGSRQGWPEVERNGVIFTYIDSQTEDRISHVSKTSIQGLINDLYRVTQWALHCDLNPRRFIAEYSRLNPVEVEVMSKRLVELGFDELLS